MRAALFAVLVGMMTGCAAKRAPLGPASQTAAKDDLAAVEKLDLEGGRLNRGEQYAEAARTLEGALGKARALTPRVPLLEASLLSERATSFVGLRRTAEARALVAEALSLVKPGDLPNDRRLYVLQMILAESYRYDGAPALALAPFERAITAAEPHEAELASQLVDALDRLATTLRSLKRNDDAARALARAYKIVERTPKLQGRARALAVRLAFEGATGGGTDFELLRRNGGFARLLMRGASGAVDLALERGGDSPAAAALPSAPAPATTVPAPPSSTVSNAALVVAAMRAGFRGCYQQALVSERNLEGAARLTLRVGPDGVVTEVRALALGLPVSAVDCVLARALAGQFEPPAGGSAVIAVPVIFIKQ